MHAMDFAADSLLLIIISFSLYTDLRAGKIYNFVTFPSMGAGILFNTLKYQTGSYYVGFFNSIFGILTALAIFTIPYILGGQAAGDLKLQMAVGSLKGPYFMFVSAIATGLVSFLLSIFVICVLYALKHKLSGLVNKLIMFSNNFIIVKDDDDLKPFLKKNLKFGISIFWGTLFTYIYFMMQK